tara:strand:+ start:1240 stop:1560 length:321 start_codon:yes stop_codon:yes gene_type:complete
MIPYIRSHLELMAVTESRDGDKMLTTVDDMNISTVDSAQRKRYIKSMQEKQIDLPNLPRSIRRKWKHNKKSISKFIDELDYNNQIQSTYELTLLARQNKNNQKDVA